MSLARRHQARILAAQTATLPTVGVAAAGSPPAAASIAVAPHIPSNRSALTASAQISMRLTHDLRRLKEIKSVAAKVAAKREMLPEYRAWCDGLLEAGRMTVGRRLDNAGGGDVMATIMVWSIDIGDWRRALELAAHILRFDVAMPNRYQRDAASLIVEEIAEAALRLQAKDQAFDLEVLERVEVLTNGIDMHDVIRAKLLKAIGIEIDRSARAAAGAGDNGTALSLLCRSLPILLEAQTLHDRVGVKTTIRSVEKAIAAANKTAGSAG